MKFRLRFNTWAYARRMGFNASLVLIALRWVLVVQPAVFSGCANIVAPSGGARDSLPPQLLRAEPATFSTGFKGNRLMLEFNEYIKIQNRSAIRLLPDDGRAPVVREKLNRIEVELPEWTPLPATTYTLYFGNGVVDYTEGNRSKDLKLVFSTGSVIDTGWMVGRVSDRQTGKWRAKARVALFPWDGEDDSAIYRNRAPYWTTTDDSGHFGFGYLPARKFRLLAWADDNKDGLYAAGEALDFVGSPVTPGVGLVDSLAAYRLALSVDADEQARIMDWDEKWPGWLRITFRARPSGVEWVWRQGGADSLPAIQPFWVGDTAYVYVDRFYRDAAVGSVVLMAHLTHRVDTVIKRPTGAAVGSDVKKDQRESPKLISLQSGVPVVCRGVRGLWFDSEVPLERMEPGLWNWEDTLSGRRMEAQTAYVYSEGRLSVEIPGNLTVNTVYRLILPKGSILGGGGQALDSATQLVRVSPDSIFKYINVNTTDTSANFGKYQSNSDFSHYVELRDALGNLLGRYRFSGNNKGSWVGSSQSMGLMAGTYNITHFVDQNNNGRCDSVSWWLKRRAEPLRKAQWNLSPAETGAGVLDLSKLDWR